MASTTKDSTITLISGGNKGIGLATATRLAKEHKHHVIIGSRSADEGAKVAASLQAEGCAASSVQLDLASDASIEAAAASIEAQFGRLDVLINNAGVLLDNAQPKPATRDLYARTFETNVFGTVALTEAVLPLLRRSALPRLVFVSSVMGSLAQAKVKDTMFYAVDYRAYDASKAAVNMMALNYARMMEDVGGRVNVACPGLVNTNLGGGITFGDPPHLGAQRIVELATLGKDGPTATFSNRDGELAW
jgi:NAD(P)-dependent dehydrogenase (short-subunit alcohol dehydrogenase family)